MRAIWPAGPPKLIKPNRNQYRSAVRKGIAVPTGRDALISKPGMRRWLANVYAAFYSARPAFPGGSLSTTHNVLDCCRQSGKLTHTRQDGEPADALRLRELAIGCLVIGDRAQCAARIASIRALGIANISLLADFGGIGQ